MVRPYKPCQFCGKTVTIDAGGRRDFAWKEPDTLNVTCIDSPTKRHKPLHKTKR